MKFTEEIKLQLESFVAGLTQQVSLAGMPSVFESHWGCQGACEGSCNGACKDDCDYTCQSACTNDNWG